MCTCVSVIVCEYDWLLLSVLLRDIEVIILVLWISCKPFQQEVVVVLGSLVVIGDVI